MTNYSRSGLMMMTEDGGRDDRELLSFSCLAAYFILLIAVLIRRGSRRWIHSPERPPTIRNRSRMILMNRGV
jgi:hypothetical protein